MAPKSKKAAPKSSSMDLSRLEEIFKMMKKHSVGEIEWENSGEYIRVSSEKSAQHFTNMGSMVAHTASPAPVSHSAAPALEKAIEAPKNDKIKEVKSPFVGTFYRSPAPEAESYVKEGQQIKRGDTLCIVEAMKLMNEIEAEFSGKVVSIVPENGQPVEFGEVLFLVEAN